MNYEDLATTDLYTYLLLHRAIEQEGLLVKIGDKVVLTEWGKQNGISKYSKEGVVKGFGRDGHTLRVLPDGLKTASCYWAGFWRKKDYKF